MRGRKSFNIRNIEAHLNNFSDPRNEVIPQSAFLLNKHMAFQHNIPVNAYNINNANNIIPNASTQQQTHNEYINAKYGVSRYASNLVSGKMFKKI